MFEEYKPPSLQSPPLLFPSFLIIKHHEKSYLLQQALMIEPTVAEKCSSELPLSSGLIIGAIENSIVDFDGSEDPYNPINWPFSKKVVTSGLYSVTSLGSVWASTA